MQYKIPQEVDVEDKIIGPFTLKGFGFIFAAVATTLTIMAMVGAIGLSLFPSIAIGAVFGSLFLIVGFVPYNGKPMYTFTGSLVGFVFKPRQRVWKKISDEPQKVQPKSETSTPARQEGVHAPGKASIESVEKQIEDLSLTIDTGGAYDSYVATPKVAPANEPTDVFSKHDPRIEHEIEKAREEVENKAPAPEPTISEIATVDPEKEFTYQRPDTSGYNIDEKLKKEGEIEGND